MERQDEMRSFGDEIDPNYINIIERVEESKSDTNNYETLLRDPLEIPTEESSHNITTTNNNNNSNNNNNISNKRVKRKGGFHRHSPHQTSQLESLFKNCAHPDEKQRAEIGRRVGLDSKQVKFWFQNRRTQMKAQIERHENKSLKEEQDQLRQENTVMKNLINNPICRNCGGPATLGEVSAMDNQNLRLENARLKAEVTRLTAIAEKFLGKSASNMINKVTTASSSSGISIEPNGSQPQIPMNNGSIMSSELERAAYMQAGVAAMDELLNLAKMDSPLWFMGLDNKQMLIHKEYVKRYSPFDHLRPSSFVIDATRETGSVFISSLELVEAMMFPKRWKEMFPCMIGDATTIEILFHGPNNTRDGQLHMMNAEFVFPSPFVPLRQDKFLRYAKKHSETMWAVVDVSLDAIRESSFSDPSVKWRRYPSGCIVQDISNGYSMVTWVEHSEYDDNSVHQLYQSLLRTGLAFGAQRWLGTLQRERECSAILLSPGSVPVYHEGSLTPAGKRSMVKLMKRMSNSLCSALRNSSSSHQWQKLNIGGLTTEFCVTSRVSVGEPGEPSGLVLSASTSIYVPRPRQQIYSFLSDEGHRGQWDVLANRGPMKVVSCFSKSLDASNVVLLLCPPAAPPTESNMLILQESWTDKSGSFIVYAPVDSTSIESVLLGADSEQVAVLPSGFSIVDGPIIPNEPNPGAASVLTVGFQILVTSVPTALLNIESVETVNNLMSCTIQKIRLSLGLI